MQNVSKVICAIYITLGKSTTRHQKDFDRSKTMHDNVRICTSMKTFGRCNRGYFVVNFNVFRKVLEIKYIFTDVF